MTRPELRRVWVRRGQGLRLDADGFLDETFDGAVVLAEQRHVPFLALVGEAGLGKTRALAREADDLRRLQGGKVCRWTPGGSLRASEIADIVRAQPGGGGALVHVLLDGFEEGGNPLAQATSWLEEVMESAGDHRPLLRLRVACRPFTWRAVAREVELLARRYLGDEAVEVLDLCPLRASQVTEWARDAGELLAKVRGCRVGPLVARPLGLEMLEGELPADGRDPAAVALYRRFIHGNVQRRTPDERAQAPTPPPAALELARRAAAVGLFSGRPELAAQAVSGGRVVMLEDVVADGARAEADRQAWNALLSSSPLLTHLDHAPSAWAHASFAEFLAAEALAAALSAVGREQEHPALALLFSAGGGERVPTALAGVAAWAAALSVAVFERAVRSHPTVLLQVPLRPEQSAHVVRALLRLVEDDRYRDLDHLAPGDLRALDLSQVVPELQSQLTDPTQPVEARRLACDLLAECDPRWARQLSHELVELALADTQPLQLRACAAWVVADRQLDEGGRLRPLAEPSPADPEGALQSAALAACWPDAFGPDPFHALEPSKRAGFARQSGLGSTHLPTVLRIVARRPELVAPALAWLGPKVEREPWAAERLVSIAAAQPEWGPEVGRAVREILAKLPPPARARLASRAGAGGSWAVVHGFLTELPRMVTPPPPRVPSGLPATVRAATWAGKGLWSASLNYLWDTDTSFADLVDPDVWRAGTEAEGERLLDAALDFLRASRPVGELTWPGTARFATRAEMVAVWALTLLDAHGCRPPEYDEWVRRWAPAVTGMRTRRDAEDVALVAVTTRALDVAPDRVLETVNRQLADVGLAATALDALARLSEGSWLPALTTGVVDWLDQLGDPGFAWQGVRLLRRHAPDRLAALGQRWAKRSEAPWAAVGYDVWSSVDPTAAGRHLAAAGFHADLLRRLVDRLDDVRPLVAAMESEQAAQLLSAILASGATLAGRRARPGRLHAADPLERLEARLMDVLVQRGEVEALDALRAEHPAQRDVLNRLAGGARRRIAERADPCTPKEVLRVLAGTAWPVRTAHDLQRALVRALHEVQAEIRQHPAPCWNEARKGDSTEWTLKSENALSDHVKVLLKQKLGRWVVGPFREVALRPTERPDMLVAAAGGLQVLVEAKGAWNDGLEQSLPDQLADRYLAPEGLTHGVYLVYWASPEDWTAGSEEARRGRVRRRETREALEDQLHAACLGLQARPCALQVEVFVLDCSRHPRGTTRPALGAEIRTSRTRRG